jgi:putative transposase
MPDHFHVLMTPQESLEKAVQCIKGGFSFRAKKELSWIGEIWIAGFSDHRIRDDEDYEVHRQYITKNPVEAGLAERGEEYAYCSANGRFELDAFLRGLKPGSVGAASGGAEAPPFQSKCRFRDSLTEAVEHFGGGEADATEDGEVLQGV